jgi:hypothetical protein
MWRKCPGFRPTTSSGSLRKNGIHYADVGFNKATIHSEPIDVELITPAEYVREGFPGSDGINNLFRSFEDFWEFRRNLLHKSALVLISGP